jgi:hypothetical protein
MRSTYVTRGSPEATYEIEADRFGNYTIRSSGKVVKRVTSVSDYLGKPRWGSRKLELNAIEDAKVAIERLAAAVG